MSEDLETKIKDARNLLQEQLKNHKAAKWQVCVDTYKALIPEAEAAQHAELMKMFGNLSLSHLKVHKPLTRNCVDPRAFPNAST